jgi:hypothetical protein
MPILMFKFPYYYHLFILLMIFVIAFSCEDLNEPYKTGQSPYIIYAIGLDNANKYRLKYSGTDSIDFKDIPISITKSSNLSSAFPTLYSDDKRNRLVIASQSKLTFINLNDNKVVDELDIPDTYNPEEYILYGEIQILPCEWDENYCILMNRSVYLINLIKRSIEKTIWQPIDGNYLIYIHNFSSSNSGEDIYMQLTYYWRNMFQKLVKLNLKTGNTQVLYEFNDKSNGGKYVYCVEDYVLSFAFGEKENKILKFSTSTGALIDSSATNISLIHRSCEFEKNKLLIHQLENGNLYLLDCNTLVPVLYMENNFDRLIRNRFQRMSSGDLFDLIFATGDGKNMIYNLTKKEIIKEFKRNEGAYDFIIKEVKK